MTDLLFYFTLCFLSSLVVCAALFWLTRPVRRLEAQGSEQPDLPLFASAVLEQELIRVMGINEDTRPLPASKHDDSLDSFDYEELWEAAARIPRESQEEKAKIDRWVNEAIESDGEDFEL